MQLFFPGRQEINSVVSVFISANLHQMIVLGGPGLSLGDEEYVRPVQVET